MASGKEKPVRISVSNGTIHYDHPKRDAHRGDVIAWSCDDGPFAIQFLGISPVETAEARSEGRGQVVKRPVRADAEAGTYLYACAVCVGDQVYIDANCPAIIIDYP